jgi:uncharacterized OB-fold protein
MSAAKPRQKDCKHEWQTTKTDNAGRIAEQRCEKCGAVARPAKSRHDRWQEKGK